MKNYASIQQLRAAAALGVVVFHLQPQMARMGYIGYWPEFLSSGVDVFFVISGFIMWVTTFNRPTTPKSFILNRMLRIAPLYWLFTIIALMILLIAPNLMQNGGLDWGHVLKSFLFIPAIHPAKLDVMEPLVFAGWTLNYEIFFYVIFSLCLLLTTTSRWKAIGGALVLIAAVRLLSPAPLTIVWFYSSPIIIEFALGILIGVFVTANKTFPTWIAVIMTFVGVVTIVLFASRFEYEYVRIPIRAVGSTLIVFGIVACELNGKLIRSKLMNYLGDASYSLYLSHGMVLSAFSQVWRRILPEASLGSLIAFVVFAFILASAVGVLVYRYVEQPLTRLLKGGGARGIAKVSSPSGA